MQVDELLFLKKTKKKKVNKDVQLLIGFEPVTWQFLLAVKDKTKFEF